MAKTTKESRIRAERKRILELFKGADQNKLDLAKSLIDRAAYITVTLEDLEAELSANGWTEAYQNGREQAGVKRSASADVHISLTKNLTAIVKQLGELVPPAPLAKSRLKELMDE